MSASLSFTTYFAYGLAVARIPGGRWPLPTADAGRRGIVDGPTGVAGSWPLQCSRSRSVRSPSVVRAPPPSPKATPCSHSAYNIDATTHIKKFDQTINIVGGTFVGGIDLSDGSLVGAIALPPAQFTFRVAGIVPLVTATARIVPKAPVVGHLDIYNPNLPITATSVFNIRILEAHAEGTTVNLVGDYCRTASFITVHDVRQRQPRILLDTLR